jgi:hypothetical protein
MAEQNLNQAPGMGMVGILCVLCWLEGHGEAKLSASVSVGCLRHEL